MRTPRLLLAIVGLWMTLSSFIPRGTEAAEPPLRVGISLTGAPIDFKRRNDIVGIEADFAHALGEYLGRPVEFVELKWKDQIPALIAGKTDVIMSGMSITRIRSLQVAFSEPYLVIGQMALVRKDDAALYVTASDIVNAKGRVGAKEQTTGEFLVIQEFPHATKQYFTTVPQAARALKGKKIDLLIMDSPYVLWAAREDKDLTAVPILLTEEPLGWAIHKDNRQLLDQVNAFLSLIEGDGRKQRMLHQWLEGE